MGLTPDEKQKLMFEVIDVVTDFLKEKGYPYYVGAVKEARGEVFPELFSGGTIIVPLQPKEEKKQ